MTAASLDFDVFPEPAFCLTCKNFTWSGVKRDQSVPFARIECCGIPLTERLAKYWRDAVNRESSAEFSPPKSTTA